MSHEKSRAHVVRPTIKGARQARERAELYRHFMPEWPALAESFEREAAQIEATLNKQEART